MNINLFPSPRFAHLNIQQKRSTISIHLELHFWPPGELKSNIHTPLSSLFLSVNSWGKYLSLWLLNVSLSPPVSFQLLLYLSGYLLEWVFFFFFFAENSWLWARRALEVNQNSEVAGCKNPNNKLKMKLQLNIAEGELQTPLWVHHRQRPPSHYTQ